MTSKTKESNGDWIVTGKSPRHKKLRKELRENIYEL